MKFTQPAYSTAHFSSKVWVKCPKCSEIGLVRTRSGEVKYSRPTGSGPAFFECSNCDFKLQNKNEWFGYYQGSVSSLCGHCGSLIHHQIKATKEKPKRIQLFCDSCKKEKEYDVFWKESLKDGSIDPYFGMDLLIQIEIKSNLLWFYNLDHLRYLIDYVQVTLREDNSRHKYSMISNLPQWVISAKNRDVIVRKLNNLEKEVSKKIGTLSM